jgi:hypothetical protein
VKIEESEAREVLSDRFEKVISDIEDAIYSKEVPEQESSDLELDEM